MMRNWPFLVLSLMGLASLALSYQSPIETSAPLCKSAADCNTRGTNALKAGKFKTAVSYFTQELIDAEDGDGQPGLLLALNNLSVAYIRQGDFLMGRAWVQQSLAADEANPSAIHDLAVIDAHQRNFRWPKSPNGLYADYIGCGYWSYIRIRDASSSTATFEFEGVRVGANGCGHFPAATGELTGQIVLRGESGTYSGAGELASCKIEMKLEAGSLSAEEAGNCGFGAGVHVDGDYQRVSVR